MSDLARFLPLSRHHSGDESGVHGDRRDQVHEVVRRASDLVASRTDAVPLSAAFLTRARLRGVRIDMPLTEAADAARGRRRGIRQLATTVRAYLLLCEACHVAPELDPLTLGAVALYASGRTPTERRAVIAGRTLTAIDADWAFGTGPALRAPALEICAFVLGTGDRLSDRPSPQR